MSSKIQIDANFSDKQTLKQFADLLQQRMKYMHETARDSIAACAINALKSIRAATKVAKPSKVKVQLQKDVTLYCSCTSNGKKKYLCLRHKDSNARYSGNVKVSYATVGGRLSDMSIWKFTDNYSPTAKQYYIVAPTQAVAKQHARKIVQKRAMQYAGLAKRAIGVLMMKTATVNVNDAVGTHVNQKALQTTERREVIAKAKDSDGGKYGLILEDNLRYALDATKGGQAAVNVALKKAMNKIASQINMKLKGKDFFSRKKLPTPFPELTKRKK